MELDLTALLVAMIIAVGIPYLTELIVKASAPDWVRTLVVAALSALDGALVTVTYADFDRWQDYVLAIGAAWLVTMRVYFAGLTKKVKASTATFGIGG